MAHPKTLIEFMQLCPSEDACRQAIFERRALDIFHGVSPAHLQAYLDEYCYRLNRRQQRLDIFRCLLDRCLLYTAPANYSMLKAARGT